MICDAKFNPKTQKVTIAGNAGPDTVFAIPAGTCELTIQGRAGVEIRYAWAAGDIAAGDYFTIPGSSSKTMSGMWMVNGANLYLRNAAAAAGDIETERFQR